MRHIFRICRFSLPVLLFALVSVAAVSPSARADYTVQDGCARTDSLADLLDAAADRTVSSIRVTGDITVPADRDIKIGRSLQVEEGCTIFLEPGSTLTVITSDGDDRDAELYVGVNPWQRMFQGAEACVVWYNSFTMTRVLYADQSDAEEAFRDTKDTATGGCCQALFAAGDVVLDWDAKVRDTFAVLNGHDLTITNLGKLTVRTLRMEDVRQDAQDTDDAGGSAGGTLLVYRGGRINVQNGLVDGDVDLPYRWMQLPDDVDITGDLRMGGALIRSGEGAAVSDPFPDVTGGPYYDAVLWGKENGIATGLADGDFHASAACTRGQALTFLWRALGEPALSTDSDFPFADLAPDSPYYLPVAWAWEQDICRGTSDAVSGLLAGADSTCTRGQFATFLWRCAGRPVPAADCSFQDVSEASPHAAAISWAVENGYLEAITDASFSPNLACTRGEVLQALWLYFG